jgi:hypothetical protein
MPITEIVTSTTSLAIGGLDVMTHLGIRPGPEVGRFLNLLLNAVIDDPDLNTKEALLKLLTSMNELATGTPQEFDENSVRG